MNFQVCKSCEIRLSYKSFGYNKEGNVYLICSNCRYQINFNRQNKVCDRCERNLPISEYRTRKDGDKYFICIECQEKDNRSLGYKLKKALKLFKLPKTQTVNKHNVIFNNHNYNNTFLNQLISNLNLSERSRHCLQKENIVYVKDLISQSADKLMMIPNFGEKSLREIESLLVDNNLSLENKSLDTKFNSQLNKRTYKYNSFKFDKLPYLFIKLNTNNLSPRNVNVINANLNINYIGELITKSEIQIKLESNLGRKSLDELKDILKKYGLKFINEIHESSNYFENLNSIPNFTDLENHANRILAHNSEQDENLDDLILFEDLFNFLIKKILSNKNPKNLEIIEYHYGLNGGGKKVLEVTGKRFNLTRERIRQISTSFEKKVNFFVNDNINSYILKKINSIKLLIENNLPSTSKQLLKILIKKKYLKKDSSIQLDTVIELIRISYFLNKKNNYSFSLDREIIDRADNNLKIDKIKTFANKTISSNGLVTSRQISNKFKLKERFINELFKTVLKKDYRFTASIITNDFLVKRNRLYNYLQKIFYVNSRVSKQHLSEAINKSRIDIPINKDHLLEFCRISFDVIEDNQFIEIKDSLPNSLSDNENILISCFNEKKAFDFYSLQRLGEDKGVNANSMSVYATQSPLIRSESKLYFLIGTKFEPFEFDRLRSEVSSRIIKNVKYWGYLTNGIWCGFILNENNLRGRNFFIDKELYKRIHRHDFKMEFYNENKKQGLLRAINAQLNGFEREDFKSARKGDQLICKFNLQNNSVKIDIHQNDEISNLEL